MSTLYRDGKRKKQVETLENDDIDYLMRKEPVTCTHYYIHRENALRHLICNAYTGKYSYNAGGKTIYSTLLMPFNKSHFLPLNKEMLDTLSKLYDELQLVFIDETSLIGSRFLYSIDN